MATLAKQLPRVLELPYSNNGRSNSDLRHVFALCKWRSGGTALEKMGVGIMPSELDLLSQMPLPIVGSGRLQL